MQEQDRFCEYILKAILRAYTMKSTQSFENKQIGECTPHLPANIFAGCERGKDVREEHRVDVLVLGPTLRLDNVQSANTPKVYAINDEVVLDFRSHSGTALLTNK